MTASPAPGALLTREAAEAPDVVRRQLIRNADAIQDLVARLRHTPPAFVATCARGSSDHAATYGKYLIERSLGLPVASLGPSLASIYGGEPGLSRALFIAMSQSGRGPDTLRLTEAALKAGALVVAIVNDETSPLAGIANVVLPLHAGPERSVAATKSFLGTCFALLQLVAAWSRDADLDAAAAHAPDALEAAGRCDWAPGLLQLRDVTNLFVIGRGLGLGVALEMALKFKETCRIHAEAFSAAEVVHGPLALAGPGFPALVLDPGDEGSESARSVAERLIGLGADVQVAGFGPDAPGFHLPMPTGLAPALVPLVQARAFYGGVAALAAARGLDPDNPPHLLKITRTI